jgi:hypothetical protein
VTVLLCAGLLSAAALVPAPPVALPFIIVICIGSPMVASWELRTSLAILRTSGVVRGRRDDARVLAEMRRYLEQLPETQHRSTAERGAAAARTHTAVLMARNEGSRRVR